MGIISLLASIIEFVVKVWGWISGRSKQKLINSIIELEKQSRQAQLNGDLDMLRRVRGELEEARRRLDMGEY